MKRIGQIFKWIAWSAVLCQSATAMTDWTFSIPSSAYGNFTASESTTTSTVGGSFFRETNGYIKLIITSRSGTYAPALNTVRHALEAPGFALFFEPLLTTEGTMIAAAAAGPCPLEPWIGIFNYFIWRGGPGTSYDVSSTNTPAFGVYTWTPATNISRVDQLRNVANYGVAGGFSAFNNAGTCASGEISFTGSGDRGGKLYVSSNGGGVYTTQTAKSLFMLPQRAIESAALLNGSYSGYIVDTNWFQVIKPVQMTLTGGNSATGDELTDIDLETTDSTKTWLLNGLTINTPFNGMVTGNISVEGGTSRPAICNVYFSSRTILSCVAQDPADATKPLNVIMVSTGIAYTSGTADTYSYNAPSGYSTTSMGTGTDTVRAIALQSDEREVAVGDNGSDFAVARFFNNGALDTTFGTSGKFFTSFSTATADIATGVAIDSAGRIAVGGYTTISGKVWFAVARLTTAGALDGAFNTTGKQTTSFTAGADNAYALAITTGDKILVAGGCGATTDFCVARYLTNGTLDTGWATTGKALTTAGSAGNTAYAMAVQSDGKVIVAGDALVTTQRFASARYLTNGTLDTSWGTTGVVTTSVSSGAGIARALAIQPDGKVILAGGATNTNMDFTLARYSTAGVLDTTFGVGGIRTTDFSSASQQINAIALQADGKIVATGWVQNGTQDIAMARYTTNGTLDTTFAASGLYLTTLAGFNDMSNAVVIQSSDNKMVSGGVIINKFGMGRQWLNTEVAQNDYYKPLVDAVGIYPVTAYSLRRLSWAYTGPLVRVRRSSTNTESDIGYNTLNELDSSTLLTFCAATNCYITKWYDQAGSRDIIQTVQSAQPQLVATGAMYLNETSRPMIKLNGNGIWMKAPLASPPGITGDMSVSLVNRVVSFNSGGTGDGSGLYFYDRDNDNFDNPLYSIKAVGGNYAVQARNDAGTLNAATGTIAVFLNQSTLLLAKRSGNNCPLWVNSIQATAGTGILTGVMTLQPANFPHADATDSSVYYVMEYVLFNQALSAADQSLMEVDQQAYYGTP